MPLRPHRAPVFPLLSLLVLAACRDYSTLPQTPTDVEVPLAPTSAHHYYECTDPAGCVDPSDTHVIGDVTFRTHSVLSTSFPIYDARTGQYTSTLVTDDAPLHVHVDAGYTPSGLVKVITNYTDGPDYSTRVMPQVTAQELTGNSLTQINSYNYALTDTPPADLQASSPMGFVGSTQNGDITAGVLIDVNDTTQGSASKVLSSGSVSASRITTFSIRPVLRDAIARAQGGAIVASVFAGLPVHVRSGGPGKLIMDDDVSQLGDEAVAPRGRSGVALAATARPISSTASRTRTFVGSKNGWTLAEDRTTAKQVHSDHVATTERVTTWSNMVITRNRARDTARRKLRPTTDRLPLPEESSDMPTATTSGLRSISPQVLDGSRPSYLIACDDQCTGGGTTSYPTVIGFNPMCSPNVEANINVTGDVNLLYQHGFSSDGMTWCAGSYYQRTRFTVRNELRFTTSSSQFYELQAGQLVDSLTKYATGYPGPYVFVGHSNGGLVSRLAAQNLNGNPALVRGVMSVSSPHAGLPLARLSTQQLIGAITVPTALYIGCNFISSLACTSLGAMAAYGAGSLVGALGATLANSANPVVQQAEPGSAFQAYINSRGNPVLVAGIQDRAWDRWTPLRLWGDSKNCGSGSVDCGDIGGRRYVQTADKTYHTFIKCSVVSGLLAIVWAPSATAAYTCGMGAAGMRAVDNQFRAISVGNSHGDGVVPESSQLFPGAPSNAQFLADDSDSHLGVTSSGRVTGFQMTRALNTTFSVPITH